jgi:hypothetical protein
MANIGVLDARRWELHVASGTFSEKPCAFRENDTFRCFGTILYGGSMEEF